MKENSNPPTAIWRRLLDLLYGDGLQTLADHVLVQRSADVTFLGAASCTVQNARGIAPSRYAHTEGVVRKVLEFAEASGLGAEDRRHAMAAALVHDLGHFPLSHSAEISIRANLGHDHHTALLALLRDPPTQQREIELRPELDLRRPLLECRLDIDRVEAILGLRERQDPLTPLFKSPINVDTLDAIPRAAEFAGMAVPHDCDRLHVDLLRWNGDERLIWTDLDGDRTSRVSSFLRLKQSVYDDVIYVDETARVERALDVAFESKCADSSPDWQDLLLWGDVEFVRWLCPDSNGARMCANLARLADETTVPAEPANRTLKRFSIDPVGPVPKRLPLADLGRLFPRSTIRRPRPYGSRTVFRSGLALTRRRRR